MPERKTEMKNSALDHLVHLSPGATLDLCGSTWIHREKIGDEYRFVNQTDPSSLIAIKTTEILEALACGEVTISYDDSHSSPVTTYDEFIARVVKAYSQHTKEHGKPPAVWLATLLREWSHQAQASRPNKTPRIHVRYPTPSTRAFLARLRRLSAEQSRSS
jgi:hypothetical protein